MDGSGLEVKEKFAWEMPSFAIHQISYEKQLCFSTPGN